LTAPVQKLQQIKVKALRPKKAVKIGLRQRVGKGKGIGGVNMTSKRDDLM
jgi:hypothetical protein